MVLCKVRGESVKTQYHKYQMLLNYQVRWGQRITHKEMDRMNRPEWIEWTDHSSKEFVINEKKNWVVDSNVNSR